MTEKSAQEKLAELDQRDSNAETVENIATTGHVASVGITVVSMVGATAKVGLAAAAAKTCAAGIAKAVAGFGGPLVAGLAGGMLGGWLGTKAGDWFMDTWGKDHAVSGPTDIPACVGHHIVHNNSFLGAIGGLIGGLIVGIAVGALVVATGGAALGVLAATVAAGAGGLAGGFVGGAAMAIGSRWASDTGEIHEGSPNVTFEGKAVARVTDPVICSDDPGEPLPQIAEGSKIISVNSLPLARKGHKITCSAVIQDGCKTITADKTTGQYGPINADMSVTEQSIVSGLEVLTALWGAKQLNRAANERISQGFSDPVDAGTGEYLDYRTDFHWPHILPLTLKRAYTGRHTVSGFLGTRWLCNWSQYLEFDSDGQNVTYFDAEGLCPAYSTVQEPYNCRNLLVPHYRLTGNRRRAVIFDEHTQQGYIFTPVSPGARRLRLSAIKDRNRNEIRFLYNGVGHLTNVEHSGGLRLRVMCGPEGLIYRVSDEADGSELVRYDYTHHGDEWWLRDAQTRFNGTLHYTYTEQGWLNSWRDNGPTHFHLRYDDEGRVVATGTEEGLYNDTFRYFPAERKTEYTDATGAVTTLWFDETWLLIKQRDPLGRITEWGRDEYDHPVSIRQPGGRVTQIKRDYAGRILSETDADGRKREWQRDAFGQITAYRDHRTTAAYRYNSEGNLVHREVNDQKWQYRYTEDGQIKEVIYPDGSREQWAYNAQGSLTAHTDAAGRTTHYAEDRWLRLTGVTDAEGRSTHWQYRPGESNPHEKVSAVIRADGGAETFRYDGEGKIAVHTGAMGQTTRYRHGAFDLLREVEDAGGQRIVCDYDGAARLTQLTRSGNQRWRLYYDAAGQLAGEDDWSGRRTVYRRDEQGRLAEKVRPDGSVWRYARDEFGRVTTITGERQQLRYGWDLYDRMVSAEVYECNDATQKDYTLTSRITLEWDDRHRLVAEEQDGQRTEYRYDEAGWLTGTKTADGETQREYDASGALTAYRSNDHRMEFGHTRAGQERSRRYRPEDEESWLEQTPLNHAVYIQEQGHDACGRTAWQRAGAERLTGSHESVASWRPLGEHRYAWDKSGRLTGHEVWSKTRSEQETRYRYDNRDQITSVLRLNADGPAQEERYRYTVNEQIAESRINGILSQHDYHNECVTQAGDSRYEYDACGRVIKRTEQKRGFRPQEWRYRWDDFDRLREVRTPDGEVWQYRYDAFGRRTAKRNIIRAAWKQNHHTVSEVRYQWLGMALSASEKRYADGSPALREQWHYRGGFELLAKEARAANDDTSDFYPILIGPDGAPQEMYSANGRKVWRRQRSLWGQSAANDASPDGRESCDAGFMGQWQDEESGLWYNLHRYMDSRTGHYLSQDPLKLGGGLNTQSYVHDPVGWCDPLGLKCGGVNRRQALNEAKDLAGIPRSQQPNRQWTVGNNPMRRGQTNYKYSEDLGSHGRYYEYTDARGHKRVIVEHTADPRAPGPHTHAGQPKPGADPRTYDFKNDRYQKINNPSTNDHHIYYDY
ncbi:RHS repeat-associated core domain-containing protein [Salmonella enterica]